MSGLNLPADVVGLRLARIDRRGFLILCEAIRFVDGRAAVDTVLRRAQISGRVEVAGEVIDHFADALDAAGDIIATVALDAKSYKALKTKWMRCKVEAIRALKEKA